MLYWNLVLWALHDCMPLIILNAGCDVVLILVSLTYKSDLSVFRDRCQTVSWDRIIVYITHTVARVANLRRKTGA